MNTFKYAVLICTALMSGFMFTACSDDETSENDENGNSEVKSELYTTRPTAGAGFQASYDEEGLLTGYIDCEGCAWEVVSHQPLKLKCYETYGNASESYEATFTQNKNGIITSGKVVFNAIDPDDEEENYTQTLSFNCSYNKANQLSKISLSSVVQEFREGKKQTETLKGTATLTYSDGKLIKSTGSYNGKDVGEEYKLTGSATYSYDNGMDNKMKQFGYCVLYTAVPTFNLEMFAPLLEIGMFGAPSTQLPSETLLSISESSDGNSELWSEQEELSVMYALNEDGTIKTEKVFSKYSEGGYHNTDNFTFNYTYWISPISSQTIKQNAPSNAKRTRGFFKFPRIKRNAL